MVDVKNLSIRYGDIKAVDDVSFFVDKGEIFGIIGPNGAGKTSTIECIEGLRTPESGSVSVTGLDPQKDRQKLYNVIGVQLQETSFQEKIKVWELCRLFSSMYESPRDYNELLERFGLGDKKKAKVVKLSGGQKQKLSIILSLIGKPQILFLDELTTGLDPEARRTMWGLIKSLRDEGITIIMTTHFMDEAEHLCDRIALMIGGKINAIDTTANLKKMYGAQEKVSFNSDIDDVSGLKDIDGVSDVSKSNGKVSVFGTGKNFLGNVVMYLQEHGIAYDGLTSDKSSLEDVFLKATGYDMNEGGAK